jgi:hypothetical protein
MTFVIFDVLRHNGVDLTALPCRERRRKLERLRLDGLAWTTSERFEDGNNPWCDEPTRDADSQVVLGRDEGAEAIQPHGRVSRLAHAETHGCAGTVRASCGKSLPDSSGFERSQAYEMDALAESAIVVLERESAR